MENIKSYKDFLNENYGGPGKMEYPEDNKPGRHVPKGGEMCTNCIKYKGDGICGGEYWKKWSGTEKIPFAADEYCCNWWLLKK